MWTLVLMTAAAQEVEDIGFTCNDQSRVVDAAPIEVTCTAALDAAYDRIEWLNGLGDVVEGATFTTLYAEPGQYTVHMYVEGYGEQGDDLSLRRDGAITACGLPEPEFDIVDKGGRTYEIVNKTPAVLLCIEEVEWEVRDDQGEVVHRFPSWQPSFLLDEDGDYTVTLTAMGLAGTAEASQVLEARYGLTEELTERQVYACSTGGSAVGWWLVPVLALMARRRRWS